MDSCASWSSSSSSETLLGFLLRSKLSSRSCGSGEYTLGLIRECAARELNAFLWISLIAFTAYLVGKVVKLARLWIGGSRIPGPPSPSFYGHCKLISRENLVDVLSTLHEKYGAVVKLWLGPTQLLVSITDEGLVKEMLSKAEDKLPIVGRAFQLAFGRSSLFMPCFDKVQKRRELLEAELNNRLHEKAGVVSTKVLDSIMEKMHLLMSKGSVDSKVLSQHMAFQFLGARVFGEAFLGWSEVTVYEELLMSISKDAYFWASYNVTPFWRWGFWSYQGMCTKLKCLTQKFVQLCKKNYERCCHFDEKPKIDLTAGSSLACSPAMMPDNLVLKELNSQFNSSEEPCANIMGVMFHGCLTSASLIGDIFLRLASNQELQDQIYLEIVTARKLSQKDDYRPFDEMVLLSATIYESARLLPAWPLLQRCSLNGDLHLKSGTTIPAGAVLVVPVQLVQMEGLSWKNDCSEFNPYRFLSRAEKGSLSAQLKGAADDGGSKKGSYVLDDPRNHAAYLPFGYGTRACVGQKFVIHGLATLFASLLEHYEIRLKQGLKGVLKPPLTKGALEQLPSLEMVFVKRNA
ncbi:taurochenodeoxycholic 6 alpha-hydroxylase-like [Rhodamnia argentea]|uniref:Taurochenodeoxycholic 6 alpha-hydroxylase-like n=1 Tax=Rhodamnia argentea TaxID=178133 RepID=A0A8B8Q067_9MYRT|nr:taurochenodeoxycholic 6 alpha-hydroxylase-like [Rhodamnia argentea]